MSADKYPERHKRDLLLSDRISQGTVKDIIKDIFEINFDDDEKEEINSPHKKGRIYVKNYDTYLTYIVDDYYDWSYPAPEMQLLWRLDDLQDRLEELVAKDAPYRDGYIYSEDDIRYALPEHLFDISKVERAIELAKDDLVNKYGLPDPDVFIFGDSEMIAEDCVRQITLFELLSEELPKAA